MIVGSDLIEDEKNDQRSDVESIKPAGLNRAPSRGLENSRAMSPPTIEPAIPSNIVRGNRSRSQSSSDRIT
jgi:hypothetical protein